MMKLVLSESGTFGPTRPEGSGESKEDPMLLERSPSGPPRESLTSGRYSPLQDATNDVEA